jgi:hypothetical protein
MTPSATGHPFGVHMTLKLLKGSARKVQVSQEAGSCCSLTWHLAQRSTLCVRNSKQRCARLLVGTRFHHTRSTIRPNHVFAIVQVAIP